MVRNWRKCFERARQEYPRSEYFAWVSDHDFWHPRWLEMLVAESGLYGHADLQRMRKAGARAFLVGESLMRQPDVAAATRELLGLAA